MYFGTPENPTQPYPGLLGGTQAPSTLLNGTMNSQDLLNLGIGLLSNSTQPSGVGLGHGLQYMQAAQQQRQANERDNQQLRMQQATYQNQMDQYNRQKTAQNSLADLIGHPGNNNPGIPYKPGYQIPATGLAGGQINQQQFNQQAAGAMARGGDMSSAFSAAQPFMPFPTSIMTDQAKNALLAGKTPGTEDWNNYLLYKSPVAPQTITTNNGKYLVPAGQKVSADGTTTVPLSNDVSAIDAGKISSAQQGLEALQQLRSSLVGPDGHVYNGSKLAMTLPNNVHIPDFMPFLSHDRMMDGLPIPVAGEMGREGNRLMDKAISAIALSQSPRGLSGQQLENARNTYAIGTMDSGETVKRKLDAMESSLRGTIGLTGRDTGNTAPKQQPTQSNSTLSDPAQAARLNQLRKSQGGS